ncbi:class I SAM-dependent methyltransferase [Nitrospira sp. M1]
MNAKKIAKSCLLTTQKICLKLGFHLLPVHHYTSVPNVLELQREPDLWRRKSELPGLLINLEEQAANLKTICMPYQKESEGNKTYREAVAEHWGPGYGYIEAQALHAFIRHYKPKKIIEVGSGVSTSCMQKALDMNYEEIGEKAKLLSIEPYPSEKLRQMPGLELISEKVQRVPFDVFSELDSHDLLFIDSSHTVRVGGDVNYLILEVLPRLKKGTLVHFHDIFFPYDYQRDVLQTLFHWPETSLLQAFLCFNQHIKVIFCLSLMHYFQKNDLKSVFPEYEPQVDNTGIPIDSMQMHKHFPSSIFFQIQ